MKIREEGMSSTDSEKREPSHLPWQAWAKKSQVITKGGRKSSVWYQGKYELFGWNQKNMFFIWVGPSEIEEKQRKELIYNSMQGYEASENLFV